MNENLLGSLRTNSSHCLKLVQSMVRTFECGRERPPFRRVVSRVRIFGAVLGCLVGFWISCVFGPPGCFNPAPTAEEGLSRGRHRAVFKRK